MDKGTLKAKLHKLIDEIDNQNLLEEYYEEIKHLLKKSYANVWDTLTEEQKKEVLLSYEESEVEQYLHDNDSVMDKYKDLR